MEDTNVPHVLWIDDEVARDSAAVRLLELEGFHVEATQSGAEGLSLAQRQEFDAILLDLLLPDEHGIDVLQKLIPLTPAPVGILTGYGDIQSAVAAMKLGAADYREKRLDDDLSAFVRALIVRGPRPAPRLTETEWISVHLGRLSSFLTLDESVRILLTVLLSRSVSLRFHAAIAEGVSFALSGRVSVESAIDRVNERFAEERSREWTTHPILLTALAALEGDVVKRPQKMFGTRVPLSRAYLGHKMVRDTGRSPVQWCRAAVLRRGLQLVMETGETISQIAYACGYQHHSQFDHHFSSMYGAAPMVLRALYSPFGANRRLRWNDPDG